MYLPAHFDERRPEVLHALVRSHPLGLMVTQDAHGELAANTVPFLLDPERGPHGTLRAHVARANPVWRDARTDSASLVVFQGPQAYVSPNWYAAKAESGKVVPTWNYVMVQARGRVRFVDDAAWLRTLVGELTDRHEAGHPAPWKVDDAPADYVATMLRAIVGIEIPLDSLVGKWKVSQNRSADDRAGVVAGLASDGAQAMARQVARPGE
ncbi:MAG TPA: FMN-binding negative transcriptional regulator [Albitalea sp.]|uniref:FMN-binding negative transcriptional regulator n=1 Tax=Piscinibacter sp. TaxID=1903157 RepID=UPI002ED51375